MQTLEPNDSELSNNKIFELIDARFGKKYILYEHLHNSYNELINQIIFYLQTNDNIFEENRIGDQIYRYRFKFENLFVRPPLNDNGDSLMYPMDARDRNATYSIKILAKITQLQEIYDLNKKEITNVKVIGTPVERETAVVLPCMVRSKYCSLEVNRDYNKKDCEYDPGGYFIINGSEKIVLSIERMVENKPLVFLKKDAGLTTYSVKVNSKSYNPNVMMQPIEIRLEKNYDIIIKVPILNEVSVFVLMRALGLETDKEIIKYIMYNDNDIDMLNILKISIDLSKKETKKLILSKEDAYFSLTNKLRVVKKYVDKDKKLQYEEKKEHLENLLRTAFMPHMSNEHHADILKSKAYFLGLMVNRLLNCYLGRSDPDDRDSFTNKRIDMPGELIFDLFKQNYKKILSDCNKFFKKRSGSNHENPLNIINQIKANNIEQNIKAAMMTGNWGKKKGVAQMYPRLTFLQSLSFLRRVDQSSSDSSTSKLTGPRHYHPSQVGLLCLTADTEVLLSDGTVKLIKDIKNGDSVISTDKETMKEVSTPIKNWFTQNCEKLFKITTITGRTIKCTPEHKLLTKIGDKFDFAKVDTMKENETFLISRHMIKYLPLDKETNLIIDSSKVSEQYKIQLTELGYLDKKISQEKLEIIARLIGLSVTDGHIGVRNDKTYDCEFYVGEERDAYELLDDITKLGFGTPSISRKITKHINHKNGKHTIYNTYSVIKNGAFAYLLNYLGAFDGKKTELTRKVSEWLINANNRIQREYINGIVSGDGCRISINKNKDNYKINCGCIRQACEPTLKEDTIKYLSQVSNIFNKFNIKSNVDVYDKPDENGKLTCVINFEQSYENINNYADNIGFRYCNEKRRKSALAIEYIKHKNHYADIKDTMYKDIIQLYEQDIKCAEICKTKKYSENIVKRIITNHRAGHVPKGRQLGNDLCMSYEDFVNETYINGENMLIKIKSIEEIAPEPVYDFETVYSTHSFVANGICTSNCPVESPEHSNIGLVKHLSLIGSITVGSQDQAVLIYNMLKDNKNFVHLDNHSAIYLSEITKVFLNGEWIGMSDKPSDLYYELKQLKQNGVILRTNGITYDIPRGEIRIYTDSGRLFRPVLKVKENKVLLTDKIIDDIIKDTKLKGLNKFDALVAKYPETIDFIDMEEQFYCMVAEYKDKVLEMKSKESNVYPDKNEPIINRYDNSLITNYTHCEFHPTVILGIIAGNIPFANHNQGPRNIFQYAQGRQAMGIYSSNYRDRLDISYILYHTQKPLVNTKIAKYVHTDILPCGENAVVMIGCYTGHNQDDSIIFNQTSIDRGLFRSISLKKWSSKIEKNQSTSQDDIFMKPDISKLTGTRHAVYDKLNDKGYIPEETVVENGDVIIGKVTPIQPAPGSNKCFKDSSEIYKSQEPAIIDKVFTGIYDSEGYEMIKVRTRSERIPKTGDKFCARVDLFEVLTDKGWLHLDKITLDHKIATLVDDNKLVYEYPLGIYKFKYKGEMYKVRSQQVDIDVTMDHQMYVKTRYSDKFELLEAKKIVGKRYKFKKNCGIYDKPEIKTINIDGSDVDYDAYLELLGMFIADGSLETSGKNYVNIAGEKERKIVHLQNVCERLKVKLTLKKKPEGSHLNKLNLGCNHRIKSKTLYELFRPLNVGAINKYLPEFVWNLNMRQSKVLLESLISCDGSHNNQGSECYYTSSKSLANDVMKLAIHAGWSGSIKTIREEGVAYKIDTDKGSSEGTLNADTLSVRIIKTKNEPQMNHGHVNTQNGQSEETYEYEGMVGCLEVPSHVFMIRQNNKNVWIGNCSRHGQKGTIGLTLHQSDMPFTKEGISPDLIINPNAIPSRMTIAQLIECVLGKVAAIKGMEADGTSFNEIDVESIKNELEKLGYERNCTEYCYNGMTGQRLRIPMFIGPTYYQRLKHLTSDKIHSRARGPITMLTHQPPEGRSKDGGLRCGEMERDSIISHGMSKFLKERFLDVSDAYSCYVCDICGLFAQRVIKKENKSSPQNSDTYQCVSCKNKTKISKIIIPYAFKLLVQELMSMNIAPRIRTKQHAL